MFRLFFLFIFIFYSCGENNTKTCDSNSDCENQICDNGSCVDPCERDSDCKDKICDEGRCVEGCKDDDDCENQTCDHGRCVITITGEKYDFGNPNNEETLALELINRARANPNEEAEILANLDNTDVQNAINYFNVNLEVFKNALKSYPSRPPLAFNKKLNSSALVMSNLIKEYEVQSHEIGGTTLSSRVDDSGYDWMMLGENIFAYSKSVVHAHAGFCIDWGNGENGMQPGAGHRENIMNKDFKEIGISFLKSVDSDKVGPNIETQDFALPQGNKKFITGVVYEDKNNNNFYDLGEGIKNINIVVEGNKYYSVSSSSGAYVLPVSKSGEIKIQAYGDNFKKIERSINIKNENYKLDFLKIE